MQCEFVGIMLMRLTIEKGGGSNARRRSGVRPEAAPEDDSLNMNKPVQVHEHFFDTSIKEEEIYDKEIISEEPTRGYVFSSADNVKCLSHSV